MAATNVQAFSGDLDIAGAITSNLEVGTANLFVDTVSGNVGIGLTDPGFKLDVNGTLHATDMNINDYIYHNGDTNTYFGFSGGDTFKITEGGTTALQVNSSGNIDIPNYIRHFDDTNTYFGFGANDTFVLRTSGTERMRIDSDGDVGIGTASPRQKLEVANGNFSIVNNIWKSGAVDDQLAGKIDFHLGGDSYQLATPVAAIEAYDKYQAGSNFQGDLAFKTMGSERMRITSNGSVGIGRTDPGQLLDVAGNVRAEGGFDHDSFNHYSPHPSYTNVYVMPNKSAELMFWNSASTGAVTGAGMYYVQYRSGSTYPQLSRLSGSAGFSLSPPGGQSIYYSNNRGQTYFIRIRRLRIGNE
jgi:hypothetical protein